MDREHQNPRGKGGEAEFAERNPKCAGDRGYQRKQEANGGKGPSNIRCYNCSKTGHFCLAAVEITADSESLNGQLTAQCFVWDSWRETRYKTNSLQILFISLTSALFNN